MIGGRNEGYDGDRITLDPTRAAYLRLGRYLFILVSGAYCD